MSCLILLGYLLFELCFKCCLSWLPPSGTCEGEQEEDGGETINVHVHSSLIK